MSRAQTRRWPRSTHPFTRKFGSFTNPSGVAIEHASGDVYVLDIDHTSGEPGGSFVEKYDPSGAPITSYGEGGKVLGSSTKEEGLFEEYGVYNAPGEIAVDNDPTSPSHGDLYVPDIGHNVVDKFDSAGTYISQISVSGYPSGVAVDPTTGYLYVSSFSGGVYVYGPDGESITEFETIPAPSGVAVDSHGASTTVYVVDSSSLGREFFGAPAGTAEAYEASSTSPLEFNHPVERQVDANPSYGIAVDPAAHDVYVDEGSQVTEFESSGELFGEAIGLRLLTGSSGLAVDEGNLDVSDPGAGKVAAFGQAVRRRRPGDGQSDGR